MNLDALQGGKVGNGSLHTGQIDTLNVEVVIATGLEGV
jgi:hypothetical protein